MSCKVWVLTHVFEVTTIERSTVNVHARAEKHVLLPVLGFLADAYAVEFGQ